MMIHEFKIDLIQGAFIEKKNWSFGRWTAGDDAKGGQFEIGV